MSRTSIARRAGFLLVLSVWSAARVAGAAEELSPADSAAGEQVQTAAPPALQPFFNTHCVRCHGPEEQNGDRRFDAFAPTIGDSNVLVDYQDVLDQLILGEMPPADEPQPSEDERRRVVASLTSSIATYNEQHRPTGNGTVLRRLNSREYRNTIRDLLSLNMTMFDPTVAFPRDQLDEHLDNVGASLVTSGHLLNKYLDAAETIVHKAIYPLEKPERRTWAFRGNFRQQPEIDKVHQLVNGHSHLTLYDVPAADKPEGAYGPLLAFQEGVPHDGWYELRVRAEALNRLNPYDPKFTGVDPSEPFRMGIVAGNALAGPMHKPQPIEPLLAEFELADESRWYTARVWLDQGYAPRFNFQNGLMDARNMWSRVIRAYPDQFPRLRRPGIVEARFTAIKYSKLPQIHVHEVEIEGPIIDEWPTAAQRAALGKDCEEILATREMTRKQLRSQLAAFASRAYRRPVRAAELSRLEALIAARREAGATMIEAWTDGLAAVLCSPSFLYLDDQANEGRLSPYALASRLSYFLWSSMPDEELLSLAADGKLLDDAVLDAQAERMLADPKSDALVDGFLDSWLTLRDFGSSPPEREAFNAYYHHDLGAAMRRETRLFTRALLDENLSVVNFLDSDFTFVNRPLARMYGLSLPSGPGFERVALTDERRGGLLGQASVLTVTANGIDTSPVVRGVWLLENILGTPPSPPPADVEPLDPDVRGATTIRDQLQKHRSVASCNDCHRKIDPLGFALENFDPIGQWRETYDRGKPIDSIGELPGGKSFAGIVGLKEILVDQKDQFIRALASKLMAYGMGRRVEALDRPHVDALVAELNRRGDGFRDLVKLVATSEPFRAP